MTFFLSNSTIVLVGDYMKINGVGASKGIIIGKVHIIKPNTFTIPNYKIVGVPKQDELNRFFEATKKATEELEIIKSDTRELLGEEYADIIDAQIEMVNDTSIIKEIKWAINHNHNATFAFHNVCNKYIKIFHDMENEYISERASDVEDIRDRVLRHLLNQNQMKQKISEEVVIVGNDLSPSMIVQLDLDYVKAFVTNIGSDIAHNAIIARSLELPGVVNTKEITKHVQNGDDIIVNGTDGYVIINPTQQEIDIHQTMLARNVKKKEQLMQYKDKPIYTKDGERILFYSNITSPLDLKLIDQYGSDGIGLYRTEFLYMEHSSIPSTRKQIESYHKVLSYNKNKKVVIRTLDIGGDKQLPYIDNADNDRGIGFSLKFPDILKQQITALLLSNTYGNLHIMFPYIKTVSELLEAKSYINECQKNGHSNQLPFQVGIMVETVEAAENIKEFLPHIDFVSIGTNDFITEFYESKRQNQKSLDPFHPKFLEMIQNVIQEAKQQNVSCSICGELATNKEFIAKTLAFGLTEFSMNTNAILEVKEVIDKL